MSAHNPDSQDLFFYRILIAGLLANLVAMLVVFGYGLSVYMQISNMGKIDHTGNEDGIVLDRKVDEEAPDVGRKFDDVGRKLDETGRQLDEILIMLKEMQATLDLIVSRLDIRVEPEGQAAAATPNDDQTAPETP